MRRKEFLWGASTSAHQVEGNNVQSDWWIWERETKGVARSGKAIDHYNRFVEDFQLLKQLGHTSHRFSLEWSRIEPSPGKWNRKAVEHYREVLEELRGVGITPMVTLQHFTLPQWLAEKGGWESSESVEYFVQYVEYVAQHLGDLIPLWNTINEPVVYALNAYWQKKWPPQKRSVVPVLRVLWHMAQAHRKAYRILHRHNRTTQVGIAKQVIAYLPLHTTHTVDRWLASIENWCFNHSFFFLTGIHTHDFIGINYYFPAKKRLRVWPFTIEDVSWPDGPLKSDVGWPIHAPGLTLLLEQFWKRYRKPIFITENGIADWDDSRRPEFIRQHLRAIEAAQKQGVDVRGYFHWSLFDNFEWDAGFWPRFGLVEIDYETLERKPRPSAYVYKAIIEQARKRS